MLNVHVIYQNIFMASVVTVDTQVGARVTPCGICGGQSGNGIGFSPSEMVSTISIIPLGFQTHIYQLVG
jgi:hypothetical protein